MYTLTPNTSTPDHQGHVCFKCHQERRSHDFYSPNGVYVYIYQI